MKRLRLGSALFLTASIIGRLLGDPLYDEFQKPSPLARPFVRWWWNGSRIDSAELTRELDVLQAAGVGGVEINTIGMPDAASAASLIAHPVVPWLSPEWSRLVGLTTEAARAREMTADLIVGSGWPFGGRFLEPSEQTQRILLVKRTLHGPAHVPISRAELLQPPRKEKGTNGPPDGPVPTGSELLFVRLVPSNCFQSPFASGREYVPADGTGGDFAIDVPPGDFDLYVGIHQTGFTQVKLGAAGADGPVVNHFNAAAVRKYLDHMATLLAPAMHGSLGRGLRALFVDSLELDHANWTDDLATEFRRRRGYELQAYLPFVLDLDHASTDSEFDLTVRRARYDFDQTLIELFDERFLTTYVDWAKANQVKARIQAYGREIHPLHGSMKAELPEGETWLWVDKIHPDRIRVESTVINKYVASAANLTGQRLRSFEAMTNAVPVFRETLQDFKRAFDATILAGLNHPILHGFNYTPRDAGFPGWVRFGCYLNERTPWWPYFRQFNDYAARLDTVMRRSEARARIAVLAPRPEEWGKHGLLYQPFPEVADPWYQFKLIDAIQQAGYNADYISEKILTQGGKSHGQLNYGPCAYDLLILEGVGAMEVAAAAALADFVAAGGQVLFIGQTPTLSPGLQEAAAKDAQVRAAIARLSDIPGARVRVAPAPGQPADGGEEEGAKRLLEFATGLLDQSGLAPDVAFEQPRRQISQIAQRAGDRSIYFIVNGDPQASQVVRAQFPGAVGSPFLWDPQTGSSHPLTLNPKQQVQLELAPAGSALVVFDPVLPPPLGLPPPAATSEVELSRLHGPWQLTLEPAGSAELIVRVLPQLVDFSRQDRDEQLYHFGGVATYGIDFDGTNLGDVVLDLGEVHSTSEVTLNGVALGSRWWGLHRYPLAGQLRPGPNHLQIKVSTMLANQMRGLTGNPVAQRWAGWAPPIPAGLAGPVRLVRTLPDPTR